MERLRRLDPFDTGIVVGALAAVVCALAGGSLSLVVLGGAAAFGVTGAVLSMLHEPDVAGFEPPRALDPRDVAHLDRVDAAAERASELVQ